MKFKKAAPFIFFLTIALHLIPAHIAFARGDSEKDFDFIVLNENDDLQIMACVKKYKGKKTAVWIPSQYKGSNVTEICEEAFAGKGLTSLILPKSINIIARQAFENNKLKIITFPNNINRISYRAFADNALTGVTIPGRVLVGAGAFMGNKITCITIGSNVSFNGYKRPSFELGFDDFYIANKRSAGTYTYNDGRWSVEYNVDDNEEFIFGISHRGDGPVEVLISGYRGTGTVIEIPGNFPYGYAVNIGEKALAGRGLTSVTFPDNLNCIEPEAFADNALTDISIPEDVYLIHYKAFAGNKLTSITIPDDISIGSSAFAGNNITQITVGSGVYLENEEGHIFELGFDDFYASNKERAGTYLYQNGSWSVKYDIIENGFAGNIGKDGETAEILDYFGSDTFISIPSQLGNFPVTTIGDWAFYKKGLTGVTIPGSVTAIGTQAFAANGLTGVVIPNSVTRIGTNVFDDTVIVEYVPDDEKDFQFELNKSGGVTVTGYAGKKRIVCIPALINDMPVTEIGKNAFTNAKLSSVIIPDSVIVIRERSFHHNQITNITIPHSVAFIDEGAFTNNYINRITIGASVMLNNRAFTNGFPEFYHKMDNRGGTYRIIGKQWQYTGTEEESKLAASLAKQRKIPAEPQIWKKIAMDHFTMKYYDKAIAAFTEAILLDGEDANSLYYRGLSYEELDKWEEAVADFSETLRLKPDDYLSYTHRGFSYKSKGDLEAALADYNESIRLYPRHYVIFALRADVYSKMEKREEAFSDFSESIRLNPKYHIAYSNRGNIYLYWEEYDKAIADYTEAIRLNPASARAFHNRAVAHYRKGDREAALADFDQALAIDPEHEASKRNRAKLQNTENLD